MAREERERLEYLERWFGLLSFGAFLMLIGLIWSITPNLYNEAVAFFKDLKLVKVISDVPWFPAPTSNHPVLYGAVAQLCLYFGAFHIFVLAIRFVIGSPLNKRADTFIWMVFWLGTGFLLLQLGAEAIGWFAFLGGLVVLIGLSILIRSLMGLFFRR